MDWSRLLIATTNPGKLSELQVLLAPLRLTLSSLSDFPGAPAVIEDGDSYVANATKKAVRIAHWSGWLTIADDSGLEVDALGGAPGVHSARYTGPQSDSRANRDRLLAALANVPAERRTARFRCVVAVATPDGAVCTVDGACAGLIAPAPRGAGGFGYDSIFLHPATGMTFAELPAVVKNRVSHRADACTRLRDPLLSFVGRFVAAVGVETSN